MQFNTYTGCGNCVCITCFVRIKSRLNFAVKNGTQKIYSASWLNLSGALLSINPEQTPVCEVPQSSCFSGGESVGHKCKMFDHTHRQRSQVGGHAKLEDGGNYLVTSRGTHTAREKSLLLLLPGIKAHNLSIMSPALYHLATRAP